MTSFTTCPACNYARQPADDAPDWECPNCHKAYVKTARIQQNQETESLPQLRNRTELQFRMKLNYKPSAIPAILYLVMSIAALLYVFIGRQSLAGVGIAILTMPWSAVGVAIIDSMHMMVPVLDSMDYFDHILRVGMAVVGMTINTIVLLLLFGYFKKPDKQRPNQEDAPDQAPVR